MATLAEIEALLELKLAPILAGIAEIKYDVAVLNKKSDIL